MNCGCDMRENVPLGKSWRFQLCGESAKGTGEGKENEGNIVRAHRGWSRKPRGDSVCFSARRLVGSIEMNAALS